MSDESSTVETPAEAQAEETPETTTETAAPEASASSTAEPTASDAAPEASAETATESETEVEPAESAGDSGLSDSELSAAKSRAPKQPKLASAEGKVIGWNDGGFHVVVEGKTGFCPRSEMELGEIKDPKDYVDETFTFSVLRVEDKGRRIVLSRKAYLQGARRQAVGKLRKELEPSQVLTGTVATITDFGAFVDLGGVQGLLHVSEISRKRVGHPSEVLEEGQEVEVKILKIEQDGRRISLSMKALEPDPWREVEERFPQGSVVQGTVERTANFGAFIELAPGLTGLLPTSSMSLPRNTSAARVYHPGKEITVQVERVDPRRRRISLGLEGSSAEGSQSDLESFRERQQNEQTSFNALAAAFDKARRAASD